MTWLFAWRAGLPLIPPNPAEQTHIVRQNLHIVHYIVHDSIRVPVPAYQTPSVHYNLSKYHRVLSPGTRAFLFIAHFLRHTRQTYRAHTVFSLYHSFTRHR